ncbi:MAG: homocysteine S-methyltransferase [Nocardioides sp.]
MWSSSQPGAEVATTASYQAAPDATEDLRLSVQLARQARDEHGSGWVAASVGPYGAILADGSEYRGDYGLSVRQLRDFHRPRLDTLIDAGADVLAIETVPCLTEVEAVLAQIAGSGMPAWLSLTSADGRTTRNAEPLRDAFEMAYSIDEVKAVGVNCLPPAHVLAALDVASVAGKPLVAYPNSGQGWDAQARTWTGESAFTTDDVTSWQQAGARLIGGCCRVGPADISAVAAQVVAD